MKQENDHISWPNILALLDNSLEKSARGNVFAHLEKCGSCRDKLEQARNLRALFPAEYSPLRGDENCPDDEKIAAVLDNSLSPTDKSALSHHLEKCPSCFERLALASAGKSIPEELKLREGSRAPAWLLEKALSLKREQVSAPSLPREKKNKKTVPAFWERLKAGLLSPLPAYALAGLLLCFTVWGGQGEKNTAPSLSRVVTPGGTTTLWVYEEAAVEFRDGEQPVAATEGRPLYREPNFNEMAVYEKNGKGLLFSWPKISGTSNYNFSIETEGTEGKIITLSVNTAEEQFLYLYAKYGKLAKNRLHTWEIRGNYGEDHFFKAQSQFIIIK